MGYTDNDRYGRGRNSGGYRSGWDSGSSGGDYRRGGWEGREDRERAWRDERRHDRDDDRGFFERAGDEVRSWFGDEEAERRRRRDQQEYGGEYERRERDEDRWSGGGYAGSRSRGGFFAGDGAGDYGAGRGAGATGSWGLGAGRDRATWGYDPYRTWRERQMRELDRDYEEYQREHQARFEQEFGTWREGRQKQRRWLGHVRPQQEVVGSDGQHLGTVDKVWGDRIVLTRSDPEAGGHHHSIPCSWITNVAERVEISKTAEEARNAWRDEENRSAFLGEERREREEGPHYLNRSFSGTY
jgi:hypothetical protein